MSVTVEIIRRHPEPDQPQEQPKQYVPLKSLDPSIRMKLAQELNTGEQQEQEQLQPEERIKSKVMVINSIKVTAQQDIEGNFTFDIHTDFANLSDGTPIEGIDITANEDIEFDENMTGKKLNAIIRRCGILEKYKDYFVQDPEIIINSYELNVKKQYRFFEEFNEAIQVVGEIF